MKTILRFFIYVHISTLQFMTILPSAPLGKPLELGLRLITYLKQPYSRITVQQCSLLLAFGAYPNIQDSEGLTPMHIIAKSSHDDEAEYIIQAILEFGANPNIQDIQLHSPLYLAFKHNNIKCALALIHAGADLYTPGPDGRTPLHVLMCYSSSPKKLPLIQHLIKHGLKLNALDSAGYSFLHYTILYGCPKAASMLLELGADPTIKDIHKKSSIHYAWNLDNTACKQIRAHPLMVAEALTALQLRAFATRHKPQHVNLAQIFAKDCIATILELVRLENKKTAYDPESKEEMLATIEATLRSDEWQKEFRKRSTTTNIMDKIL
jgi:ankyrin repeat protein